MDTITRKPRGQSIELTLSKAEAAAAQEQARRAGYRQLAAAIIVEAVRDIEKEGLAWFRTKWCEELCLFLDLGFTNLELAERLEKIGKIDFQRGPVGAINDLLKRKEPLD